MEDLFYQFYDILVIAVTAVIMYVSVKNGISKTFPLIIGYALSFFIAFGFSGKSADYIYPEFFKEKNVEGICRNISGIDFSRQYKAYIDTLGYDFTADSRRLEQIFREGDNITEKAFQYFNSLEADFDDEKSFQEKFRRGYQSVIFDALEYDIPSSEPEYSDLTQEQFDESIKMMYNDDIMLNALYIEENFTGIYTVSLIRTVSLIIIAVAFMAVFGIFSDRFIIPHIKGFGITDHTLGIISGLIGTAVSMIIISGLVVILLNTGNGEMILFNTQTIEKTRIFKHIYNTIVTEFY